MSKRRYKQYEDNNKLPRSTQHYRKKKKGTQFESDSSNDEQWHNSINDISIESDEDLNDSNHIRVVQSACIRLLQETSNSFQVSNDENAELNDELQNGTQLSIQYSRNQSHQDDWIQDIYEDIDDESIRDHHVINGNNTDNQNTSISNNLSDLLNLSADEMYFNNLKELLNKEESNDVLNIPLVVSKAEIIFGVLQFSIANSLPASSIADMFKMLNLFIGRNIFPQSRYRVDKFFNCKNAVQYHAVCYQCKKYIQSYCSVDRVVTCRNCDTVIELNSPLYKDFFAIINVKDELRYFIEENSDDFQSVIHNRMENQNNEILKDFSDGILYKEFIDSLSNEDKLNSLTSTFNSDGSPVFESSTFSVWPIQFVLNEMPFNIRSIKPIVCGIWFGNDKPKMNIFLKPFVSYMNELADSGIICTINNEERRIKIFTLCCCVDSVARAPMQGIQQFNGHYGCSWCLHPGLYIKYKKGGSMKYILLDEITPSRSETNTILQMQESITSLNPVYGVKNPSILVDLSKFNIISGFVPDSMHCIDLGIGRQFMNYWVDIRRQPYSFSKIDMENINNIIQNLKVPNKVARLPRIIEDRKWWKSLEWENWILFYSIPILKSIPNFKKYSDHWELLVKAYHILLQNSIIYEDVSRAHELLQKFVLLTEKYYSHTAMTYNVHQILHLSQSVLNWGPLWCHSGYCFENGNGLIVKKIHAAKGVVHQVCRTVSIQESEIILKRHITKTNPDSLLLDYAAYLKKRESIKTLKTTAIRYFGKIFTTKSKWIRELDLSETCRTYGKIVKDQCLYTNYKKNQFLTNNSFAFTTTRFYIQLINFIVDVNNEKEYTICNVVHVQNNDSPIKQIIHISDTLIAIKTQEIERICVFIDVGTRKYICVVPNLHNY